MLTSRSGHLAAVRRDGQRRGLAHRRAGRRPQRLGVPPGRRGVSGRRWRSRRRSARRGREFSRRRSPATRSASASASFSAARTTRCSTPPARPARSPRPPPRASCSASMRGRCCHAIGSAGTQAAGLWEFLRDAADSKQLHTAKAAADGLIAAFLAQRRLHRRRASSKARKAWRPACRAMPIRRKLDRPPGHALGTARDVVQVPRLVPAHPSGRRRAAPGDREQRPAAGDIARVVAHVHQGAIDVLGPVVDPATVHQAKFSMPARCSALIARASAAPAWPSSTATSATQPRARFLDRVEMVLDREVDARLSRALDRQGDGHHDGRAPARRAGRRAERRSRQHADAATRSTPRRAGWPAMAGLSPRQEIDRLMPRLWSIAALNAVGRLLPRRRRPWPALNGADQHSPGSFQPITRRSACAPPNG